MVRTPEPSGPPKAFADPPPASPKPPGASPALPRLELDDVTVRAGSFSLARLRLRIFPGEFHVLLGPTGAGKTLLLETTAGFLRPAGGRVLLDGRDVTALPPEARGVSYMPQDLALFPHLTVKENISYGLRWRKRPPGDPRPHLADLIRATGIGHLLDRRPAALSGGEKQRAALVRALAPGPRLLLMDEPLSALHPQLRAEIRHLLRSLHRELRFTVLMVTHDLEDAFALGEKASLLLEGSLYTASSMDHLFRYPPNSSAARFFGLPNLFPATLEEVRGREAILRVEDLGRLQVRLPGEEGVLPFDPRDLRPGTPLVLGLHPEEITLVKPDRRHLPRKNLLSGRITHISPQGRSFRVLFSVGPAVLEIHIPSYAMEKLPIHEGWEGEVEIKEDQAFLMPN